MPVPKYVPSKKRKKWMKEHKKIATALKGKVTNPYAVATKRLEKKYKKKN
ncbi:MAG: hypothetical protein ACKVE3_08380 [Dissulfuribacterales bacterium]